MVLENTGACRWACVGPPQARSRTGRTGQEDSEHNDPKTKIVFSSTNGEGSLIFKGAYRSRRSRLPLREIKISLCLLNFEGCGTLDLGEIYQFGPWKRFAFDFRQHTFAHPRWNHTPGAPALRTCVFALFPPFRRPPFATSSTTLAPGPHTHANAAL